MEILLLAVVVAESGNKERSTKEYKLPYNGLVFCKWIMHERNTGLMLLDKIEDVKLNFNLR